MNGQHQYGSGSSAGGSRHHAIKIIPEEVELTSPNSADARSRSSSVQLHVPLMTNHHHHQNSYPGSGGGVGSAIPTILHHGHGQQQDMSTGSAAGAVVSSPVDLDLLAAKDAIDPPLPSPSMMKPFKQQRYPNSSSSSSSISKRLSLSLPTSTKGLLAGVGGGGESAGGSRRRGSNSKNRRRSIIYLFAIVGGSITLVFLLLVTALSPSSTNRGNAGGSSSSSSSRARALQQQALGLSRSSSQSFLRFSSYLGSYLPFLDDYYPGSGRWGAALSSSALLFGHAATGVVHTLHPILPLLETARDKEANLISRQSSTLSQAVQEYRRRYRQEPPKGFDKWWSFAKARNHTLVDEYDSMMRDLAPFKALSKDELKTRTRTLAQIAGVSLITIKDGQAQIHSKSGKWAPALALQEMMNAFVGQLPNMEIAVNEKPEGRVLPGRWKDINTDEWSDEDFQLGQVSGANQTDPLLATIQGSGFKNDWRRDGSVWEAFRRACPPDSPARRLVESVRSAETAINSRQMRLGTSTAAQQQQSDVYYTSSLSRRRAESSGALPRTRELSFNADIDAKLDLCSLPSLHTLHSAFFSDTRSIEYLYPLFSPSKPTGFADILVPFHQYWSPPSEVAYDYEFRKGRVKTTTDAEWTTKDDKVYWRGKYSRGAETPPGHFSSFQKPRLVRLANDDGSTWTGPEGHPDSVRVKPRVPPHRVLVTVNATSSSLVSMSAPGPRINEYVMDVALACDPVLGECAEQERLGYKVVTPGPLSESWRHKYVLDLDEIGLSAKFPAFMESRSAVLKSSMQREFWNDWIVPWYHYIPLSSSYAELFNIQAFFSGFPAAFQNRRSTSTGASVPKNPSSSSSKSDEDEGVAVAQLGPGGEDGTDSVTLTSEAISLRPINPAHGDVFNGDLALKDIAEQGARWKSEHLRREDMEVYVFRLMLEWARLLGEGGSGSGRKPKAGKST